MIGTTLTHYKITAKLGEGGMGEVWRATDTQLERDVAIKVLPSEFTKSAERLGRFEREAKLLAQLHHPNIASIFGLVQSQEVRALVMELVDGPTLAERLRAEPLSLEECLPLARQIAEALEKAHQQGIVHRDLKPQNIKIDPQGKVKVLDFGLAKAMEPTSASGSAAELAHSPTLTLQATQHGVILGTAAYMAPEQAKGRTVDKRADIWAFGVVLYEMLAGARLFSGDSVPDTLAGVLKTEIDFDRLPATTPPAIRRLLRRCLQRDPERRLHDIADARIVIDEVIAGTTDEPASEAAAPGVATSRRTLPWVIAGAASLLAVAAFLLPRGPAPGANDVLRADLAPPKDHFFFFQGDWSAPVILSPAGDAIVFSAKPEEGAGSGRLWYRSLVSGLEREIAGTEGAYAPFYAPDGRSIGFFADGSLKTVPIDGGPTLILADAPEGRGGAWAPDGTIVFAPQYRSALFTVAASGGAVRPLTVIDPAKHSSHRWPAMTADGRGVVFFAVHHSPEAAQEVGLRFVRLDGSHERAILPTQANGIVAGKYLLFLNDSTLFAQTFVSATGELQGFAHPLLRDVLFDRTTWRGTFAGSANRLLVARGRSTSTSLLSWLDPATRQTEVIAEAHPHGDLRLSPDGRRLAVSRGEQLEDLWMIDLERGTESRFTFEPTSEFGPVWSPDGRSVYYVTTGHADLADRLFRKSSSGTGSPELVWESTPEIDLFLTDISPDGKSLVLMVGTNPFERDSDLAFLPADGSSPPRKLFTTPFSETDGRLSPDGRFLAFSANETGQFQAFVVELAGERGAEEASAKWQISNEGGRKPVWAPDASWIVFIDVNGNLMRVDVAWEPGGQPRFGTPAPLASSTVMLERSSIDFGRDGRLMINNFGEEQSDPLALVDHWTALIGE